MDLTRLIPATYSGIVAVKQGGETLCEAVCGFADRANRRPIRRDTIFVTASAGKAFTATGILRLIEKGALRFDHTMGELLDFDLNHIDPKITVEQLLTHTSGIPDYCDETVVPNYSDIFKDYPNYKIRTSRDMLPLFIHQPMAYPPGERLHYNNTGYVVLGLIIEAVTGLPFDQYLGREIFLPCQMGDTGYYEYDRLPGNVATVYIRDEGRGDYYTNIYSSTAKGLGDGGAFTTVDDVERFWQGLYGGRLLGEKQLDLMTSPRTPEGCYGYGLWLEALGGRPIPHFEGCEPGISFISTYDHREELLITLVSNRGDDVWAINRSILREFYADVPPQFYYGE